MPIILSSHKLILTKILRYLYMKEEDFVEDDWENRLMPMDVGNNILSYIENR